MNLLLVDAADETLTLAAADPRAKHIRDILGMKVGDRFDAGAVNGPRGKALIASDDAQGMTLTFEWGAAPRQPMKLSLVAGLSRPQTMRKILRVAPELGITAIHVVRCQRSEPGYADSSLWTGTEWRDLLKQGAEQAFSTWIPTVSHHANLEDTLDSFPGPREADLLALDNYEATLPLAGWKPSVDDAPVVLCIGPERGWDGLERAVFRNRGYKLAHLGPRVLRTETAVVAGVSLVAAALGEWAGMKD